jgi:hypothetical protein|nr:MAG TPA: hypothetical protein [Caudoviricetes sp.]
MEKLKMPKKYTPEKSYSTPIRIRKSTQNLLDAVAEETGWNKIDVVEKMIEFAFDNIEWVTLDEYNKNKGDAE